MSCKDLIKKTSKACNYSILLIKISSIAHSLERERERERERLKEREEKRNNC